MYVEQIYVNSSKLDSVECILIKLINTGKGMPYLPAAAHKGRIKNIRVATLRDTKEERNPGIVILKFEEESLTYDRQNEDHLGHTGVSYL